jgi:2-hydroxychromene-2-carboxylate isomerase
MTSPQPILYYDLGSPYAYMAAERVADVLGTVPRFEPVLVGGIFVERGHGSWSQTSERAKRIVEIEARAKRYGLPRLAWPTRWPNNTLRAMRAATWATGLGEGRSFALTAFRRAFREGADLSREEQLIDIAESIGRTEGEILTAIEAPAIKDRLREATSRAWARGVAGVPCLEIKGEIFYGDDRLEAAAERLSSRSAG